MNDEEGTRDHITGNGHRTRGERRDDGVSSE